MKDLDYRLDDKRTRINFEVVEEAVKSNETTITTKAKITRGTGAPSGGSDKDLYIDDTGGSEKLYVNVNGTWKYVALT